jgi:hypothetical protein
MVKINNFPIHYRFDLGMIITFSVSLFLLLSASHIFSKEIDPEKIIYLQGGNQSIEASLVPENPSGRIVADSSLIRSLVDGKTLITHVSEAGGGRGLLTGTMPKLQDGRYRASIGTYLPSQKPLDRSDRLILVDSHPPVIELIEPGEGEFPREARMLVFKLSDSDNGSGISIDTDSNGLKITAAGVDVSDQSFVMINRQLHLMLHLSFPDSFVSHGAIFKVGISLKDRAGNTGHFLNTFKVREILEPEFHFFPCGDTSYIETRSEFLVYPSPQTTALRVGMEFPLDIMVFGYNGRGYQYPGAVQQDLGESREVNKVMPFFQEAVGGHIEITSMTGNIGIQKLPDTNLEDSMTRYKIYQNRLASMGNQVEFLKIRYPVSIKIEEDAGFCNAKEAVTGRDDSIYNHIPQDKIQYHYETILYPVFLEVEDSAYDLNLFMKEAALIAEVRIDPIEIMDTGASWFAVDGVKHWFTRHGASCRSEIPVQEGLVHYQIALAGRIGNHREARAGDNGRTLLIEDDYRVRLAPPEIIEFRYSRALNMLQAHVADIGTPIEKLKVRLQMPGMNDQFDFDADRGEFSAVLPYTPMSVMTATLSVTDQAGQTTTERCTIFGEPEKESLRHQPQDSTASAYYATVPHNSDIRRRIGFRHGKTLVETCEKSEQQGIYVGSRFVPISVTGDSLLLVQLHEKIRRASHGDDRYINNRFGTRSSQVKSSTFRQGKSNPKTKEDVRNLDVKLFYGNYDQEKYEIGRYPGISSVRMGAGGNSDVRQTVYCLLGYKDGKDFFPADPREKSLAGLRLSRKISETCSIKALDLHAPVISAVYHSQNNQVHASIHDHGMPLDQLDIEFSGQADFDKSNIFYRKQLPFNYRNGGFTGQFMPPDRGEFFILKIIASDKAGNSGHINLKICIPRKPPEVSIAVETRESGSTLRRNAINVDALMTAEARDDSKLRPQDMIFWLDDKVLPPFGPINGDGLDQPVNLWARQFHFKGLYAARLDEGSHLARFRATDALGLSAETTKVFEFNQAPVICNFKVMPDSLRRVGGPSFTATIYDQGGDLNKDGIRLSIDGHQIDAALFFYDRGSGYFAVEGDLAIDNGRHLAKLVATDSRGNGDEVLIRFSNQLQTLRAQVVDDDAGIVIDTISLMELERQNGDGKVNPGERVRLFVALRNDSEWQADGCRGHLAAENDKLTVEIDSMAFGTIAPKATLTPTKGFDLQVDSRVLDGTVGDPLDTHFNLFVQCNEGFSSRMPFVLPIYRPTQATNFGSAVKLRLDPLPPSISADRILVSGEVVSTTSNIAEMSIRVNGTLQGPVRYNRNGGRFEANIDLNENDNVIEVEAWDEAGARGLDRGYVFRSKAFISPEITISTPDEGSFFQCEDFIVAGALNAGSGEIDEVYVEIEKSSYSTDCPVSVNGNSFSAVCSNIDNGGTYDVHVVLETDQGFEAEDVVGIVIGDCF